MCPVHPNEQTTTSRFISIKLKRLKSHSSASWFTLIGAIAALVHYIVAVAAETGLHAAPAWANIYGFICAFPVSYFGHRTFSFPGVNHQHQQALPKFLLVAVSGFFANQSLLLLSLNYTPLPFWLALGLVMVIVAVSTYLLSRHWAFKSK